MLATRRQKRETSRLPSASLVSPVREPSVFRYFICLSAAIFFTHGLIFTRADRVARSKYRNMYIPEKNFIRIDDFSQDHFVIQKVVIFFSNFKLIYFHRKYICYWKRRNNTCECIYKFKNKNNCVCKYTYTYMYYALFEFNFTGQCSKNS